MKVYSPNDIATILQIKPATLRKYSKMLEEQGYEIQKNNQNHRYYRDKDIIALRKIVDRPHGNETLEETIQNIVKLELGSIITNDTNSGQSPHRIEINEMKEMINKQNELMQHLTEQMDRQSDQLNKQQEYINESLKERDRNLMQTMNEMMETRRQIASAEEKKPGFFSKLFRRE